MNPILIIENFTILYQIFKYPKCLEIKLMYKNYIFMIPKAVGE